MAFSVQVGDQTIDGESVFPLLMRYQLLPQLLREVIIDQATAAVECSAEEQEASVKRLCDRFQLATPAAQAAWARQQGLNPEDLATIAVRPLKLEKFKAATFGKNLESYFLKRKGALDQVIYSLIRTQDIGVAQELYFRLQDDQASFGDLARAHSQGPEAETGGMVGPVELETPHPTLAKMLSISQPGQLWPPTKVGDWVIIVRLEKLMPAQLNEAVSQRLLNELFNQWLQTQLQSVQLSPAAGQTEP
ncbi:MAG: peptidylprolyl isomerase [Prochlorotrichaceae cyanobacterium]|jgi:parvulin-like peptidyl-prolyl isomerase